MKLIQWNPFRELEHSLANMQRAFDTGLPSSDTTRTWLPATDIKETKKSYVILAEMPGIPKEAIKVHLEDNVLRIEGERQTEKKQDGDKEDTYHSVERIYGKFYRSFTLPDNIAADKVNAAYKDGVLKVLLPKTEQAKSERELEIKVS